MERLSSGAPGLTQTSQGEGRVRLRELLVSAAVPKPPFLKAKQID